MRLAIVVSSRLDPYWNLAVENHLLQYSEADVMTLYLWRNHRTVVVGRNQNPFSECDLERLLADGGFLLRRTTGGGAVFHDGGNLNFSFVVPAADYDQERQFDVVRRAVESYGIAVTRSGRNDLLAEGRKFSGNAFAKGRTHHLHHGTLLVAGDMSNLQRYLKPSPTKLAKHGVASVQSRVVNLDTLADVTVENIQPRLVAACEAVYGCRGTQIDYEVLCADSRVRELHDRYGSEAWLTAGWRDFKATRSAMFDWGDVAIQVAVADGTMTSVRIATDALDVDSIRLMEECLEGATLDHQLTLPTAINTQIASDILNLIDSLIEL